MSQRLHLRRERPKRPNFDIPLLDRQRESLIQRPSTNDGLRTSGLPSKRFAPALERMVIPTLDVSVDVERGIIKGYASIYNTWDHYNTRFMPGCFAAAIARRHHNLIEQKKPSRIKFLWQHRSDEPLGLPVTFREESGGLYAEAHVTDPDNGLGKRALRLAAEGVVDGLSVGFDYVEGGVRFLDEDEARAEGFDLEDWEWWWFPPAEFTECDLHEYSLVTFPGVEDARVSEVIRSMERTLVPGHRPSPAQNRQDPPTSPPKPTRHTKRCDCSCQDTRGTGLASVLENAISSMESDDMPRADIISGMASEAGIDSSAVNQILSAETDCPTFERLEGFADYLNVSVDSLVSAAEGDGCTYGDDEDRGDGHDDENEERSTTSGDDSDAVSVGEARMLYNMATDLAKRLKTFLDRRDDGNGERKDASDPEPKTDTTNAGKRKDDDPNTALIRALHAKLSPNNQ